MKPAFDKVADINDATSRERQRLAANTFETSGSIHSIHCHALGPSGPEEKMATQMENPGVVGNFSQGFQLGGKILWLAVLPFVLDSVYYFSTYVESAYRYVFRVGFHFSLPFYFPSITKVYDFPAPSGFQASPLLFLLEALVFTPVLAYASAGFLGVMNGTRAGKSPSFVSSANKYFVRILAYAVLWLILSSFPLLFTGGAELLTFLYVLLLFAVNYFVFMTPFAIVVDDLDFSTALSRSVNLATSLGSKTLPFVILFVFGTLLISVPVFLVMNVYVLGFFLAGAIAALMGTSLVASTLHFYVQLTQPTAPSSASQAAGIP